MKMVSKLAVAATLSLGAFAMAAPVHAQDAPQEKPKKEKKKKDDAKEPAINVSPEFRKAAAVAEAAIKAGNWAEAETQTAAAEALAKNDDEKYFAASNRLQVDFHNQKSEGVAAALDTLIASPRTPATGLGYYNFLRGDAAFKLKQRDQAVTYLLKARELGYKDDQLPLLLAYSYYDIKDVAHGNVEMMNAMNAVRATGKVPSKDWYEYAISFTYKGGDRDGTAKWFQAYITDYPEVAIWRRMIQLYKESQNAKGEQLDRRQKIQLYRMLRATNALADANDYTEYANAAINAGLPWESVGVIEEGFKNKKLPDSDPDAKTIYASAQKRVQNEGTADSIAATGVKGAAKDAFGAGDAMLASGNYAKSLELYDMAVSKGATNTAEINLNKGYALYQLGRMDEAAAAFAAVKGEPLEPIAGMWITYIKMPVKPH